MAGAHRGGELFGDPGIGIGGGQVSELIGRYDASHSGTLDRYEFETMVATLSSLFVGYEPRSLG